MSELFGAEYANAYDSLYANKDYDAECDLIEALIDSYQPGTSRILDLGCGTGSHSLRLARRGYTVLGVDRSRSMLDRARLKAFELASPHAVTFQEGDLVDLDLGETFDVALMMFAVLGYQHENSAVFAAFRAARKHVHVDGLLVFDVWYGPAVLHERPSQRITSVRTEGGKILRATTAELDVSRHLCTVTYQLWRLEDDRLVEQSDEQHAVRFFFPLELAFYLEQSGFNLVRVGRFPDFDRDPDETTWNILAVARAV